MRNVHDSHQRTPSTYPPGVLLVECSKFLSKFFLDLDSILTTATPVNTCQGSGQDAC
jgi:hypothetical protein